jgi:hypothetical protein
VIEVRRDAKSGQPIAVAGLALVLLSWSAPVAADEPPAETSAPPAAPAGEAFAAGMTLPLGMTATREHGRAVMTGFGGYDGARDAGLFEAQAAVRLFSRVSIHGGAVYVGSEDEVRPSLGAMLQVLTQPRSGLDASLSVTYRPEGLTEPEGEIETALAVGRRVGAASILASATYGQDAEGNERDGELRAAGLVPVGRILVGADARGRLALTRPDGSQEPDYDLTGGPVVVIPIDSFAITGLAGASIVGTSADTREAGVLGLLGLSRVF